MKHKKTIFARASNVAIVVILGVLFGSALGFWMASGYNTDGFDLLTVDTLLFMLLWALLATIMHELGHMLFGFISGYKFVYFKLFGVMIFKRNGKWQTGRDTSRGSLGQCIMQPDFAYSDKMPYRLYNIGGCLINFVIAGFCLLLMAFYPQNSFAIAGVVVNAIFGLVNILPFKSMRNDGYNVMTIGRTKNSKKAYWLELKTVADMLQGKNFSNMPQSYFDFEVDDLQNVNVCAALYMQYCYLVSTWQIEKATALIQEMFDKKQLMPISNANTVEVEYFNNLLLFGDDKAKAITVYNNFSQSIKNAVQQVPIPFALVAKILVNGLSARNDMQYNLDCKVMQKLIDMSKNQAEAEYANIIFRLAKQKYGEVFEEPFDI